MGKDFFGTLAGVDAGIHKLFTCIEFYIDKIL